MEVKLVARTLEVFELFANEAKPLSLTQLARGLDAPMSSTLALVRTLEKRGYVYETRKRAGYYPTRKLLSAALRIDASDPILDFIHPFLVELRDLTSETAVLGKLQGTQVVYLDVVPSMQSIRFTPDIGYTRSVYANSMGKALLSTLTPEELKKYCARIKFKPYTKATITTTKALLKEVAQIQKRGWALNIAESVADLAAVAVPLNIGGEWYCIALAGPIARMQEQLPNHTKKMLSIISDIQVAVPPC